MAHNCGRFIPGIRELCSSSGRCCNIGMRIHFSASSSVKPSGSSCSVPENAGNAKGARSAASSYDMPAVAQRRKYDDLSHLKKYDEYGAMLATLGPDLCHAASSVQPSLSVNATSDRASTSSYNVPAGAQRGKYDDLSHLRKYDEFGGMLATPVPDLYPEAPINNSNSRVSMLKRNVIYDLFMPARPLQVALSPSDHRQPAQPASPSSG